MYQKLTHGINPNLAFNMPHPASSVFFFSCLGGGGLNLRLRTSTTPNEAAARYSDPATLPPFDRLKAACNKSQSRNKVEHDFTVKIGLSVLYFKLMKLHPTCIKNKVLKSLIGLTIV